MNPAFLTILATLVLIGTWLVGLTSAWWIIVPPLAAALWFLLIFLFVLGLGLIVAAGRYR